MNGGKRKRAKGGFSSETLSFVSSKRNPQMSLCNKKCYDEVPATVYKETKKKRKTFSLVVSTQLRQGSLRKEKGMMMMMFIIDLNKNTKMS